MRANFLTGGIPWRVARYGIVVAAVAISTEDVCGQMPTVRAYQNTEQLGHSQQVELVLVFAGVQDVRSVSVPADLGLGGLDRFFPNTIITAREAGPPQDRVFRVLYTILGDLRPGSHTIGPLQVSADGHALRTEPLTLVVAASDQATVRARVDPPQVNVGDTFELIIEVGGANMTHIPEFPDIFDFAEDGGASGGSENDYSFTTRATSPGEFEIPSIPVRLEGDRLLETEPVTLVVTDEPVTVDVRTNILSETIWVGGEFIVSVEADGVDELDADPVLPATDAFAELLQPNATMGRGGFRLSGPPSLEREFRFRALNAGTFEFGPVQLTADGRAFLTEPVGVVVTDLSAGEAEPPEDLRFMAMPGSSPTGRAIYVNEPIPLAYSIVQRHRRRLGTNIGTVSWPSFEGFEIVENATPGYRADSRLFIDGRTYNALSVRQMTLFPNRDGNLVIEPGTVEVQVLTKERSFGPRPPEWPTYSSFVLTSDPVTLEVLPLPVEGRPDSFEWHVGTLEVVSWLNRTSAAIGDTVTIEVEVTVDGYMRGLPDPEIEFPSGFEVLTVRTRYATPDRDGLSGTRTSIYRLVAVAEGTYEIPAVEMSYFDPEAGAYGTSRGQPFTVTVVFAGEEAR